MHMKWNKISATLLSGSKFASLDIDFNDLPKIAIILFKILNLQTHKNDDT